MALEAAVYMEQISDTCAQSNYKTNSGILHALNLMKKINQWVNSQKDLKDILFAGKTKEEFYNYMQYSNEIEEALEHWNQFLKNRRYCWALVEGSYFLLDCINSLDKKGS